MISFYCFLGWRVLYRFLKEKSEEGGCCCLRGTSIFLLALPKGSHTHTGTDAHGGDTELGVLALQFWEEGGDLASTCAAQGVTHGDGTTVGVDLVDVQTALLNGENGLGGKGLVQLEDIDILDLDTSLLADGGDGVGRAHTHDLGGASNHSRGDELSENGESQLLGRLALHEQNSGGTIRDLGGVTGGGGSIKGGAQLGQGLEGGTGTDTIILGNNNLLLVVLGILDHGLDSNNLAVKLALGLGLGSLLEGEGGESILLGTGDVVLGGDVLGGDTLNKIEGKKKVLKELSL